MTIQDVARNIGTSWGLIKSIDIEYLERYYKHPNLKDTKRISIDEFAVAKGHKYMTVVYDLDKECAIYIGEGKSRESLEDFWKRLKKSGAQLDAIATDMSPAFIASVLENQVNPVLVFDRFHIVKLLNEELNELRRDLYNQETDIEKREVMKGTRWLILKKGSKLREDKHEKERLEEALEVNKPLATAYYLKEELSLLWQQENIDDANTFLDKWIEKAQSSKVPRLVKFAKTLMAHRFGIINWFKHPISTGPLEGFNNKIKVLKRKAYGFRDNDYFKLKILALGYEKYAFV